MVTQIEPVYSYWTETDGSALEAGKIYVGAVTLDPVTNPISVYWDAAMTQLAAQPLRTVAGIIDNAGTPSDVYAAGTFSIIVKDANDVVQWTNLAGPSSSGLAQLTGSDFVGPVTIDSDTVDEAFSIDGNGDPYAAFYNSGVLKGTIKPLSSAFTVSSATDDLVLSASGADSILFNTNGVLRATLSGAGSAVLDMASTTQGFLPPRMTTTQRDAIVTPATGLVIFNTSKSDLQLYDGVSWINVGTAVGAIEGIDSTTVPTGRLACNGQLVSRTTYVDLFNFIGTKHGIGDGSTTFALPDYRGEFLRGWDNGAGTDPDAGSRTDSGDGTTGDNIGTKQASQNLAHTHGGVGSVISNGPGSGIYNDVRQLGGTTTPSGGLQSNPTNVTVMYVIKT